ncbi:hypothetical protein FOCC_FOCC008107 [Frankliniella occidentalis]|nr:hypothetical protein FOCC_FOCC008107 [Frankliniella occidentalis]
MVGVGSPDRLVKRSACFSGSQDDGIAMAAARWPLLPLLLLLLLLTAGVSPETFGAPCGGTLVGQDSGVLQTPGFPGPYPVPLRCAWVLDASHRQEPSIALYLTQLYLLSGLTITQYAYYEREDFHMGEQELLAVSEQNALDSRVVVAHSPYLVVRLTAQRLEGNQLRALPHLLTVFGFNITWEARDGSPKPWHACSVADCSLAGACLAASDFKSFGCHCFEGHHGEDCGRGPGCSESNNPSTLRHPDRSSRWLNQYCSAVPRRFTNFGWSEEVPISKGHRNDISRAEETLHVTISGRVAEKSGKLFSHVQQQGLFVASPYSS